MFYPWRLAGGGGKAGVTRGRSQIAPVAHFQCVALGSEASLEVQMDGLSLILTFCSSSLELNDCNKRSPSIPVRKQSAFPKQTPSHSTPNCHSKPRERLDMPRPEFGLSAAPPWPPHRAGCWTQEQGSGSVPVLVFLPNVF